MVMNCDEVHILMIGPISVFLIIIPFSLDTTNLYKYFLTNNLNYHSNFLFNPVSSWLIYIMVLGNNEWTSMLFTGWLIFNLFLNSNIILSLVDFSRKRATSLFLVNFGLKANIVSSVLTSIFKPLAAEITTSVRGSFLAVGTSLIDILFDSIVF